MQYTPSKTAPWLVLLAAGQGSRLASVTHCPKQFLRVGDVPLFWLSVRVCRKVGRLGGLVLVFPEKALDENRALVERLCAGEGIDLPMAFAAGGPRRQDSVANGLALVPETAEHVLVHDAARPFFTPGLVDRLLDELEAGARAVIPGLPVTDTIKSVDADGLVTATLPRESLRAVQTPQGFVRSVLCAAHRTHGQDGTVTDDASLMELMGEPVLVVPGEAGNMKITNPEDLASLEGAAAPKVPVPCTGFGYDVHRYGGSRPMILGGIPIPCEYTVDAHSDGDVLLHALMDALLGLVGAGDIGLLFPDSDPALDGVDSTLLLAKVLGILHGAGLRLTHVDVTVVAQKPRLAPYKEAIRDNLARLLQLETRHVNVKATTEERLGFTGELLGIKAYATACGLSLA